MRIVEESLPFETVRKWLGRWKSNTAQDSSEPAKALLKKPSSKSHRKSTDKVEPTANGDSNRKKVGASAETSGGASTNTGATSEKPQQKDTMAPAAVGSREFFPQYGESNRYTLLEVIGKGSYGVVCSATDNNTGEKVAIKKITDVFEHVSDATRILREIKLLRHLQHPDIVEIRHIMLPPGPTDFDDVYVVFELMESDLHQVIKANDDLTSAHYTYFMYQLIAGLAHIHSANVFHRDLKPKNILANADCKLKICDFGLARPAFDDQPSTVFWTDYVATRWYRAPELCGSFFSKYTPAVDVWSLGCIIAEVILGRPLFPGRNVSHQLELITNVVGTPSEEKLQKVRNEKARRFLASMPFKPPVPFSSIFRTIDAPLVALLQKMLMFDPSDRISAEEALKDPIFNPYRLPAHEASGKPISKLDFGFENTKLSKQDVRQLIYQEILEYHPSAKEDYHSKNGGPNFLYPSAIDRFKKEFSAMEGAPPGPQSKRANQGKTLRATNSMPRERANDSMAAMNEVARRSDSINVSMAEELRQMAESMNVDEVPAA
uniref:Protein kinase domain-containing protein n=1 Tax=Pyramimonas obovata TaxID=1411642 RepID=A0A7S0WPX3_9CHLO|mmetsp:Transcript_34121/g.74610  ORF Transcript_34121/g.74610 Transcript_34121/m.74610 type:complete len:548 (+) Transcript_34121:331-1974(+)